MGIAVSQRIDILPQGSQVDSAADALGRRRSAATPAGHFPTDGDHASGQPAQPLKTGKAAFSVSQTVSQLLRRRTDRGEAADSSIEIPPHLERRRAWREAFGLNTWHTQQLAQNTENLPSREIRSAAALAYRSAAWRGSLDLDLAQRVSVTV